MHAYALQKLFWDGKSKRKVTKALDIGSGSGYLWAAFLAMMDFEGTVFGIEHISELADWSKENLKRVFDSEQFKTLNKQRCISDMIKIVCEDGRVGYLQEAPYDVIHVGAAATEIHKDLVEQLNFNGRMMIPVGDSWEQYIMIVDKDGKGRVSFQKTLGVRYVPLTSKEKQINN